MKRNCFLRYLLLLALILLMLLLCGCRVRTTAVLPSGELIMDQGGQGDPNEALEGSASAGGRTVSVAEETPAEEDEQPAADGLTVEDPDAIRKQYDENAAAEIIPGTERTVHGEGEGSGSFMESDEAEGSAAKLDENASEPASMTVPADQAEETGVSEDAEAAETALQYYTVLLQDRQKSLYECQRSYVYWETVQDHVTIFKTSPEHQLILNAGAYDVSARLLESGLQVDDGWVVRKDPGVIVKVVSSAVLGSGVQDTSAAEALAGELASRSGWQGIAAVRQGKILLLSEELLSAPYLQLGAMLAVAKAAIPDLFEDVDPDEALEMLISEAAGFAPNGIFRYVYNGGN